MFHSLYAVLIGTIFKCVIFFIYLLLFSGDLRIIVGVENFFIIVQRMKSVLLDSQKLIFSKSSENFHLSSIFFFLRKSRIQFFNQKCKF